MYQDERRGGDVIGMCGDKNIPLLFLMHQVFHMNVQSVIHLIEPLKIKPGQAGILLFLRKAGPLSQREIADHIGVKPPSVTVAIQKLEKLGYVERRPDTKDQRIVNIQITDKGMECTEKLMLFVEQADAVLFKNMSVEEKLLLRRLMLQMRENLFSVKEINLKELMETCPHMDQTEKGYVKTRRKDRC
ncbi:MarR family winged helix-turn-helix transcriptional regulator [Bariatricus sp. HCP28S3_A7]|uniref:MarR family winged helix-turn-helix transcriptional regulator n=1 Tax=Bariatricus sp. HCP28S3_A7 TaxID=3438894 RepID=UPI003F8B20D5